MGCGCGGKKQAMKMKLSGEMVLVSPGSAITRTTIFRTAQGTKIKVEPRQESRYCIPREDVTENPSLFVEVGPCN